MSELHEVRSGRTSWLIEFNGESWFQPYEFTAESPEDRDRILADAGFAEWLPDNDDSLDLADTLWPCRLRSRRHYLWRRVTGGFSSVKRPQVPCLSVKSMIGRMRMDLSEQQWDAVVEGQLIAPDGTRYVRRTTKTKRRTCESLLGEGAPLVLFYWAGGQLDWFDGEDASSQWQAVRRAVTSEEPRPRGDVQWNAGVWEGDDGRSLVLLTGYC